MTFPDNDILTLDHLLGTGIQPDETELPADNSGSQPEQPAFNQNSMDQLLGMGFPEVRCQKALLATGNTDNAEAAMEWLFAHMDDPGSLFDIRVCLVADVECIDIDDPIPASSSGGGKTAATPEPSQDQIDMLADMGFTASQARKALRETVRLFLRLT